MYLIISIVINQQKRDIFQLTDVHTLMWLLILKYNTNEVTNNDY